MSDKDHLSVPPFAADTSPSKEGEVFIPSSVDVSFKRLEECSKDFWDQFEIKSQNRPCARGERADKTGCIPRGRGNVPLNLSRRSVTPPTVGRGLRYCKPGEIPSVSHCVPKAIPKKGGGSSSSHGHGNLPKIPVVSMSGEERQRILAAREALESGNMRVNLSGGYIIDDPERAQRIGLITLPEDVDGANCGNCSYAKQVGDGWFCRNQHVLLPVNDRMMCTLWDRDGAIRAWLEVDQKDLSWINPNSGGALVKPPEQKPIKVPTVQEAGQSLVSLWTNMEPKFGRKRALAKAIGQILQQPMPEEGIKAVVLEAEKIRGLSFTKSLEVYQDKVIPPMVSFQKMSPYANKPCPPNVTKQKTGCIPQNPSIGSGSRMVSQENPPEEEASPYGRMLMEVINNSIQNSTDLEDSKKQLYKNEVEKTLSTMTETSKEKILLNLEGGFKFFNNVGKLNDYVKEKYPTGATYAGGFYDYEEKSLGLAQNVFGIYLHEFSHAIDGPPDHSLSDSRKWFEAWDSEIVKNNLVQLGDHSKISVREGFAEFGRLVHAGGVDLGMVESNFPKCVEFWRGEKIWPGK